MPRNKEFNPNYALDKAMYLFWENSFESTSVRDLIANTGVNFYGLYSTLGDKKEIYLKALDKYIEMYVETLLNHSIGASDLPTAVASVFEHIVTMLNEKSAGSGCMICNAAVEVAAEDVDVAFKVQRHRKLIEEFWCDLLSKYNQDEKTDQETVSYCAEFLCTQLYGMAMLVRSKSDQKLIERHIQASAHFAQSLM